MSDPSPTAVQPTPVQPTPVPPPAVESQMGTFDDQGEYPPRQVVDDDLGGMSLEDAIAGTIVEFDDGDIVQGTVVKVDKDEVLSSIGFTADGVIPARAVSIRHIA